MCKCDVTTTGRCWLWVDQWWFDKNFERLQVHDQMAVHAFIEGEINRLREKGAEMVRSRCDRITPGYCERGECVTTEHERNMAVMAFLEAQVAADSSGAASIAARFSTYT